VKLLCSIRIQMLALGLALIVLVFSTVSGLAQTEDSFGDAGADPIKLFEQGQGAHARGELEKALEFYERAIQIRPEFPEAEFQRGNALVSLGRLSAAHLAFERAIELRKGWSLPHSARGALFVREGKDTDAERSFRQALAFDSKDNLALRMLAEIRLRSNDPAEALGLARQATREQHAPISAWIVRAMAERATGDKKSAHTSLEQVFQIEPDNLAGLLERAELWIVEADYERAAFDLNRALKIRPEDKQILSRLAFTFERAGKLEEAQGFARRVGLLESKPAVPGTIQVIGTAEEIEAANSDDPTTSRKALEKLLEKNPRNAMLFARLGASYRTDNPARSLEYYRQAADIQPENVDYATGYAAAMVQARRFAEAATILRRVIIESPEHYMAHANLATALYELRRYPEALPEYQWLLRARPDISVAHYFIATAYDYLGEYPEALKAYETFLVQADVRTNQLEIDKVKLRLPSLRKQIQLGEGVKRKKSPR
jgi:tetratricopeptide (TPR) repeat protein